MHRLSTLLLCAGLTTGCLIGGTAPTGRASSPVGAQGGEVLTPEGVGVKVPAGALAQTLTLSVAPAPASQPLPSAATVGRMYLFGPEGTAFATPATVTLEVDPTTLPSGTTLSNVVVMRAAAGSASFEVLPTHAVDATHVAADTLHFSVFVPVVLSAQAQDGGAADGGGSTDGGLDGGAASCSGTCGGSDGGSDCGCTETCGADTFEIVCSGSSTLGCACVQNGQQVGVVQLAVCPGPGSIREVCGLGPVIGGDGGVVDGGSADGGVFDGGVSDGGVFDGGVSDGGVFDGGVSDGGVVDGGVSDGGVADGGVFDAGVADAGLP